jgi:hypothetical protein
MIKSIDKYNLIDRQIISSLVIEFVYLHKEEAMAFKFNNPSL